MVFVLSQMSKTI
ncbi:hypothetical protein B4U79_01108 [Dinothrombium tinctorium]|uniref:Uncharacterized protein n=1 Tax=Dinothrombium tinctorium TaxID=1965070 RepID=A0A3S3RLP5_9ACAR|nr:hypothetical protein B4U79_01108 [Dinothrombium tinctorium]